MKKTVKESVEERRKAAMFVDISGNKRVSFKKEVVVRSVK